MATRTTTPTPPAPGAGALKPVRLELADPVHRLLRKVAAEAGKPMAQYARHWLEAHLKSEASRLGIKQ